MSEEIESPPRRRPVTLFVVVALLAGLGLGRLAFGGAEAELEEARGQVESLSTELDTATTVAGRFERQLVRATDSLEGAETDRDHLVVALAEAFYVDPGAVVGGGPDVGRADPGVRRLVEGNMRAYAAGDADAFAEFFTEDTVWIFYDRAFGTASYVYDGREALVRQFEVNGLGTNPRTVGRMVQSGDLVWARYVEADTSGVLVARIRDDRIARHWVVIIGPGDGRRR